MFAARGSLIFASNPQSYKALAMATADTLSESGSPFLNVYEWTATGFGTRFSNPVALPAGSGTGVAFTPKHDAITVSNSDPNYTPFTRTYQWLTSGFGALFTNPGVGGARGDYHTTTFNNAGSAIVSTGEVPRLSLYRWSTAGYGTGYAIANPASLPLYLVNGVRFNSADTALAVAFNAPGGSTYYPVRVWRWTNTNGLGTQFTDPGVLPTTAFTRFGFAVRFNNSNNKLFMAAKLPGSFDSTVDDAYRVYNWSTSGFGSKIATPYPTATSVVDLDLNNNNTAVAMASAPVGWWNTVYAWTGSSFGTKYAAPIDAQPATSVKFMNNSTAIAYGTALGLYSPTILNVYAWSDASGFGTKFSQPSILPTGEIRDLAYSQI